MDNLLTSVQAVMDFHTLFILLIGVVAGIIAGSIPGFTITMGVALTLPFSFGMDPIDGIALMLGVQVGGSSGGLITACLLGIPGTPSAMATTFDGYPMAKNGEPGKALAIGLWASFFGTIISGIILVFLTPVLAGWAIKFGPWALFSLMIFGLSAIASLSEDSLIKGMISGGLGLMFAAVGMGPLMGTPRFTFGFTQLMGGFNFLPVLIGIFAFSQLLGDIKKPPDPLKLGKIKNVSYPLKKVMKDFAQSIPHTIRSSLIGTLVGILPAAGGSIANILSYNVGKQSSKHPEKYGTGIKEGIIASEAANNSSVGGGLIPMLALGIPGDIVAAMMLGALLIHGIQPGPLLMQDQPILTYSIFVSYFIAGIFMVIVQIFGIKVFLKINMVPQYFLVPGILLLCALGSFAINNRIFDIWVLLLFGVIGYWMKTNGFPLAPFILGIILGPKVETNLRQAISTDPNLLLFITKPISGVLIGLSVLSIAYAVYSSFRSRKKRNEHDPAQEDIKTVGG